MTAYEDNHLIAVARELTFNDVRLRYWVDFNCIDPDDLMDVHIWPEMGCMPLVPHVMQKVELFDGDGLTYQAQVMQVHSTRLFVARIDRDSAVDDPTSAEPPS